MKWSGKLDSDRSKKTLARRVQNNAKGATARWKELGWYYVNGRAAAEK